MPRLDNLRQINRLNVGAPVPIAGTESARMQGEAVAGFGKDLARTGAILSQFYKDAEADEEKVKLGLIHERATAAAQRAEYESKIGEGDPIETYQRTFDEQVEPLFEGLGEKFKAKAASVVMSARNSLSDNVYKIAVAKKLSSMVNDDRERVGLLQSNMLQGMKENPDQAGDIVIQTVIKNREQVKGLTGLLDPAVADKQAVSDSKEFVKVAVSDLIDSGSFNTARDLLRHPEITLAAGTSLSALKEKVTRKEKEFRADNLSTRQKQEDELDHSQEKLQKSNYRKYFVAMNSTSDKSKLQQIRGDALVDVKSGALSENQFKGLETESVKSASGPMKVPDIAKTTTSKGQTEARRVAMQRLVALDSAGVDVTTSVMTLRQNKVINGEDALPFLKHAAVKEAALRENEGNPEYAQNLKSAEKMVDGFYSTSSEAGISTLRSKDVDDHLALRTDFYSEIAKGSDPLPAAKKVLKKKYDETLSNTYVDGLVIPRAKQRHSKDMEEYLIVIKKTAAGLVKNNNGAFAKQMLMSYKRRLEALKFYENQRSER